MSDTYSFLGIDIAKATFEAVLQVGPRQNSRGFDNDPADFRALSRWLDKNGAGRVWAVQELSLIHI